MSSARFPLLLALSSILLADPALADLRKLDPPARSALARVRSGESAARLREAGVSVDDQRMIKVFVRGSVSRAELETAGAIVRTALPDLYTASIPAEAIETVAALPGVRRISGSVRAEPELDVSVAASGVNLLRGPGPAFTGLNGTGVLIGNVDTGADYGHGDFDDVSGNTRFIRIWDQTVNGDNPPPTAAPPYNYGSEWSSAEINSNACTETDPPPGHGTHVLGIAAGDGSQTGGTVLAHTYAGVAPKADLVLVKTLFGVADIVDGVAYIFDLAQSRGQNAVVNLSLGSHYGPHDGTSDFETALSLLSGPGRIIVKSAGNDRGVARHAEVFAGGGAANVTMTVTGSQIGRDFLVDGYYESTENLEVSVTTPDGTVIGPISRGDVNASYPGASLPNGTIYIENGLLTTNGGDYEVYFEVVVASGQTMNGTWTFTFTPVLAGPANGEVDLWRFSSAPGVSANFVIGSQPDQELISEPGNADSLITVAAYVTKQTWVCCTGEISTFTGTPVVNNLATFSSPGPSRDGRQKPDLAAPGVAIASTNTLDTPWFCPGAGETSPLLGDDLNHVMNAGTSMAAPHVTGAVALILENFGAVSPSWVKQFLSDHTTVDAFTGAVWNRDWGNGKLHLDTSTPTLISLFTAEPVELGVELRWQLTQPERYAEVRVERAERGEGPWSAIDAERRDEAGVSILLDRAAAIGTTYYYRLQARSRTGELISFGPLSAAAGVPILRVGLDPVRPNPTREKARIDFSLPHETVIRLSILDVQGRELARLAEGLWRGGRHQATWSGTLEERRVPPGLYFVRLQTPLGSLVRRVAVTH